MARRFSLRVNIISAASLALVSSGFSTTMFWLTERVSNLSPRLTPARSTAVSELRLELTPLPEKSASDSVGKRHCAPESPAPPKETKPWVVRERKASRPLPGTRLKRDSGSASENGVIFTDTTVQLFLSSVAAFTPRYFSAYAEYGPAWNDSLTASTSRDMTVRGREYDTVPTGSAPR